MAVEFKLPELGENIDSGDIVKWLVKPGDVVKQDQPLLELETGKAVVEVPSNVSGKIVELLAQEGDKVNVGDPILTVDAADATATVAEAKAPPKGKEKEKPAKTAAPQETVTTQMDRGKPAPQPAQPQVPAREPQPQTAPSAGENGHAIPAAPVVKRIAREMGIDLSHLHGTGPGGRITIEDVQSYAAQRGGAPGRADVPLPDFSRWGDVEAKPMSSVRRLTAQHLAHAWNTIPQVTQYDKADITRLEELRKRFSARVEEAGGKLTMTAILVKVMAAALERFPQFNASVDTASNSIIYKHYMHVGVAVDTEAGLLVPVIRDVDKKNVREIAVELADVSARARERKLDLAEMEGGSISISNLGGIGGTAFSPIVNWPEVAILGVSKAAMEPVFTFGRFEPRLTLPLSLSYDHRVIDGADAARFLRFVCESLEEPFLLALEG